MRELCEINLLYLSTCFLNKRDRVFVHIYKSYMYTKSNIISLNRLFSWKLYNDFVVILIIHRKHYQNFKNQLVRAEGLTNYEYIFYLINIKLYALTSSKVEFTIIFYSLKVAFEFVVNLNLNWTSAHTRSKTVLWFNSTIFVNLFFKLLNG